MENEKDRLKELEEKIKECEKIKEEYLDGWQRARAELINYKKEESERIKNYFNLEKEGLFLKIISILDEFEIAGKNLPNELKENEYIKGIFKIVEKFYEFLKNEGVEEIEALGKIFDPNYHEAVEILSPDSKSDDEKSFKDGEIVEEIKKGYIFNNKVIRPTKVKVVKK
jgi:molecular chaperone GrpE